MSTIRIKHIDPMQCGKVYAVITLAIMIIVGIPILLLFGVIALGSHSLFPNIPSEAGFAILPLIFIPIFYLIFAFVMGILSAFIYNVTYKFHQGIVYQSED